MNVNMELVLACLGIMGKGMLGIFVVTSVIVIFVNALNNLPEKKEK